MNSVSKILEERAWQSSADYAQVHMRDAIIFEDPTKKHFYHYLKNKISSENGLIAEFGVHKGYSTNIISEVFPHKKIYAFDSFKGLPEDWSGTQFARDHFLVDEIPTLSENIELVIGWFEDTLEAFLENHKEPMAFINIDCDIYRSTKTVLDFLGDRIVSGTVIVFDEYFGYNNWQDHEYRAWQGFVQENNIRYRYIAVNENQVAVKVL